MSLVATALLGVQGLLGLGEVAFGGTKLAGVESQVELFDRFGYPPWFRLLTGMIELAAGIALLVSLVVKPVLAIVGGALAVIILVGALGSHLRAGDGPTEMVPAVGVLVLALIVLWNQLGGPA